MIGTVFRSKDVPARDRFDHWREAVGQNRSSHVTSAHAADFWAECLLMELGSATVWPASFQPSRYRRTPTMVRQSDPGTYHLSLLLDGRLHLDHAGRTATFGPGDLHLVDSSQPYDLRSADGGERHVVKGIGVDFSRELLPLPPHRLRDLLGRRLPGQEGLGALLAEFLVGLYRQVDALQPTDAPRLGTVVLDLISATFAQLVDATAALPPETRQRAMAQRIQAFIRQNLHDPELTPPAIAAAHRISLSYLPGSFSSRCRAKRSPPGSAAGDWTEPVAT